MNHRERLIAALSHQQPDRVPIDIGGTVNSNIVVEGYAKLNQHYGINSEDVLCNRMTRVVKVDEQIDWIRKHTDCAAVLAVPPPFIHLSQYLRGFEDWYCDIALGAKVFDALCDAVLDLSLEMSKKILEAVGKEVEVKRAVEQCIEDMGEDGGYVLGSVHNLQPDVPLENILAMFEHAREYVPSFAK